MTVRIGVIGVGLIGQDHLRRLNRVLAGALEAMRSGVKTSVKLADEPGLYR